MSSNGSIPPNMNPAPSGASAYEPEQTGVRHSLHHCYIWLGALRAAPIIFICGLSSLSGLMKLAEALGFVSVDAFFVAVLLLLAATVLVCGVVMGARAWTYRYIWYEFDETEFSFYSGILNKRCTHVPYSKIQSVNERASLLQRLAGVRTVNIDTAGGASNKALVISYVERSATEYLRRELFRRKHIEGEEGRVAAVAPGSLAGRGNVLDGAAAAIDDIRGVFAKDAVQGCSEYRCCYLRILSWQQGTAAFRPMRKGIVWLGSCNSDGCACRCGNFGHPRGFGRWRNIFCSDGRA